MVDINLFKDDEDEGKDWSPDESGKEDLSPSIDDADLGFDSDLPETPSLDDESILDDEDVLPDFEETPDEHPEEDYEFGDVREKRAPIWLWAVLGLVVVCVFVYLFVIQPRQRGLTDASSRLTGETESGSIQADEAAGTDMEITDREAQIDAEASDQSMTRVLDETMETAAPIGVVVDASNAIVEALSAADIFGAVLINGDRFFVEYVSESAKASDVVGKDIQELTGASSFVASPEERHRRGNDIRYSGVVSGSLPVGSSSVTQDISSAYESPDHFIEGIRNLINGNYLTTSQATKLSASQDAEGKTCYVRIRVEGSKANAASLLRALKDHSGAHGLVKLLLVPQSYTDYKAEQVKVVLDFLVTVNS